MCLGSPVTFEQVLGSYYLWMCLISHVICRCVGIGNIVTVMFGRFDTPWHVSHLPVMFVIMTSVVVFRCAQKFWPEIISTFGWETTKDRQSEIVG